MQGHKKLSNLAQQWLTDCLETNANLSRFRSNLEEDHLKDNLKHLNHEPASNLNNESINHSDHSNVFDCSNSSSSTMSNLNTLIINYASKEFSLDELICDNNSLINCDMKLIRDLDTDTNKINLNFEIKFVKLFLAKLTEFLDQSSENLKSTYLLTNQIEYDYLPSYEKLIHLIKSGELMMFKL